MFTENTIWILTHGHISWRIPNRAHVGSDSPAINGGDRRVSGSLEAASFLFQGVPRVGSLIVSQTGDPFVGWLRNATKKPSSPILRTSPPPPARSEPRAWTRLDSRLKHTKQPTELLPHTTNMQKHVSHNQSPGR